MNKHQQTVYGIETLIYTLLGITPIIDEYTTMNERLSIQPDARPTSGERVKFGVMVAGNQGHSVTVGTNGIPLIGANDHTATDASLYGPLPFAARTVDDDLTAAQRELYCLRKIETLEGINHYVYYGLRIPIDTDTVSVSKVKITRIDETTTQEDAFIPSNANLYPEIPDLSDEETVTASNVSIKVMANVQVTLTEAIITEFIEAVKLKFGGDERYGVMSEFGLCTGVDRILEVDGTDGVINFNESIATQIYAFAMEHKALYYNTQELEIVFDIGNQIPLYATESLATAETL